MKKILLLTFLLGIFAYPLASIYGYVSPGNPTGFVNDYAGVFAAEQKTSLEAKLVNFEKETSNEISVVTINILEGDSIENYAEKLFAEWGIGKEKEDNGALLLIAIEDREMRIEVGYGLEGDLTDLLSSRIIRETLTPAFQQGDFFGGVDRAVDQMIEITGGSVPIGLKQENINPDIEKIGGRLRSFNFIWLVLLGFTFFSSTLARSKSWWAGGMAGGIIGMVISLFFGFMFSGLIAFAVLVPLGLLFDFLVSRAYSKSKNSGKRPPWWTGGGGWGGGRGGGGGGGFGGFGGGMSGGGGASGRW